MDAPNRPTADMGDVFDLPKLLLENRGRLALARRLGWLNAWTPIHASGFYRLDLSLTDDRRAAIILAKLANAEPGENWVGETLNGAPFELPEGWMLEFPTKGIVTTTYFVEEHQTVRALREKLSEAHCAAGAGVGMHATGATADAAQHQDLQPDHDVAAAIAGDDGDEFSEDWDADPQEVSETIRFSFCVFRLEL
jgi:hypothetical protein